MAHLGKICWQGWPLSVAWELEFSETYHNSHIRVGHCAQTICTSNVFSGKRLFLSKRLKFVMLVEGAYMASPQ